MLMPVFLSCPAAAAKCAIYVATGRNADIRPGCDTFVLPQSVGVGSTRKLAREALVRAEEVQNARLLRSLRLGWSGLWHGGQDWSCVHAAEVAWGRWGLKCVCGGHVSHPLA